MPINPPPQFKNLNDTYDTGDTYDTFCVFSFIIKGLVPVITCCCFADFYCQPFKALVHLLTSEQQFLHNSTKIRKSLCFSVIISKILRIFA